MTEGELNSVQEEIATQDSTQNGTEHQEPDISKQDSNEEDPQERNWRQMRQRQKDLEEEVRKKNELLEKVLVSQLSQQNQTEEEEEEEDPDEVVPRGTVKGIAQKQMQPLEKKIQDLENQIAKQEQQRMINSLRSQYTDFDDVVNVETLEILEQKEPVIAEGIMALKDPYKMGISSYKYIKALGILDELPKTRRTKEVAKKIEQNKKTVQSPLSYEKRPIAQAYRNAQVDSKKLYEEMMFYASQAGGQL